jgi:hypothetical protein
MVTCKTSLKGKRLYLLHFVNQSNRIASTLFIGLGIIFSLTLSLTISQKVIFRGGSSSALIEASMTEINGVYLAILEICLGRNGKFCENCGACEKPFFYQRNKRNVS